MSFAELVSDMTGVCFSDAGVGEAATYTAPTEGAVAVEVRAVLDEPNEAPFPRDFPRSAYRERLTTLWLPRVDEMGAALSPAKAGVVVMSTSHGVVRTLKLVSEQGSDPDRTQWKVEEVTS